MTDLALSGDLAATADAMWTRLRSARRVLLPTHINVDGDSLGSVLGLARALTAAGLDVVPVVSDGQVPHALQFLVDDTLLLYRDGPLPVVDLVCLVDITGPGRLGPVQAQIDPAAIAAGLNIDHHVSNECFGQLNVIDRTAAAAAELLFLLLRQWGLPITADIAAPLLAGIMTDTLSYQTTSTTPRTMRVAADLLAAGAPQELLVRALSRAKPLSTARLFGAIASAARLDDGLLWAEVTPAMLAASGARANETEGAIAYLSGVEEADVFALLYTSDDGWRASLRSNSDAIDVSVLAGRYGGGGHRRAAGCTLVGGPEIKAAFLADVRAAILAGGTDQRLAPQPAAVPTS